VGSGGCAGPPVTVTRASVLDFTLTPEQECVKEAGRELARDFATRARRHDEERSAPVENFRRLRDAGLFGIALPKELGGLGVGQLGWTVFAEELAQGDASTALAFNMHANATGGIAQRPAIPQDVKERVARLALDGKLMCTSVSEPASSSLLPVSYNPSVQADEADGGWRLHGRKFFASMFEASDYAYLYAHPRRDPNPAAAIGFLVPTSQDGIRVTDVWDTLGMRATRSNQVDYDGAFVPDELALYETDNFLESFIIHEANWAFGGYTAVYLGIGLGIVQWAAEQLATRKAKGYAQPMGYEPNAARRFAEMVMDMEQARLVTYRAAWHLDTQPPGPETFNWWVRAKYSVGQALQRTISNAIVACGVHGLFKDLGLEQKLRDGATAPVMPPNSDACAQMIGLLTLGLNPFEAPSLRFESG
jgi:alkylation response protein AidB-like acyl-CoA dehydrogenase